MNVRSADRDLPVGQPVARRTLLRGERRSRRPAPRRGRPRTAAAGSSSASAPVPTGRSQTGASRPWARNIPTKPGVRHQHVAAGGVQPGERVEQRRPPARACTQRRCSLVADVGPVRRVTDVSRTVGVDRGVGLLERARQVGGRVGDVGDPEVEAVVDGDRRAASPATRSCSRGPSPGGVGEADDAGLVLRRAPRAAPRRGRGPGRRSCACTCSAEPDVAARRAPSRAPPSAAACTSWTVAVGVLGPSAAAERSPTARARAARPRRTRDGSPSNGRATNTVGRRRRARRGSAL